METALIAAAGSGERLGAGGPKALVPLAGRPLIAWSVAAFAAAPSVGAAVIAAPAGFESELELVVRSAAGDELAIEVVTGGATRADSIGRGLTQVESELVAVHDAARPLLTAEPDRVADLEAVGGARRRRRDRRRAGHRHDQAGRRRRRGRGRHRAAAPASGAAQTPQVFRAARLRAAHAVDPAVAGAATDDAALVESAGGRVLIEPGPPENLKVTTSADLRLAELLLAERDD